MSTTMDSSRRRFLVTSTTTVGAIGMGFGAWPFIASWEPSDRALSAGAPVPRPRSSQDLEPIDPGQQITVEWRRKPVWVLRRTPEMIDRLSGHRDRLRDPDSRTASQQPHYADNEYRSIRPEYLVLVALCTHLGCVPNFRPQVSPPDLGPRWVGGYFCPCHGSRFDLAGRVFQGVPAPRNLLVPPYHFVSDSVIEIGTDPKGVS